MGFQTILVEKKGQIGIITLNRPQKSNPFGTHLAAKLNAGLRQLG
jgi:enoyl-CoA hydratase/carnithine racemase